MNIEINISKVIEDNNNLLDLTNKLKEIVKESNEETNTLKEYWDSKTSAIFYEEFEKFIKDFDVFIEDNGKISNYLQEIVANGYKEYDEKVSNYIEENFTEI